jgi:LysM repeat protein
MSEHVGKLVFKLAVYCGLVLVTFSFANSFSTALATSAGGIGIKPAGLNETYPPLGNWFVYEVDPIEIETIEDAVLVVNDSDKEIVVKLEAADALVPPNGGFALLDEKAENPNIGDWIEISEKLLTIPPDSTVTVPFTITIPKNPEVGDHIGGIIAQQIKDDPDKVFKSGGATVNVKTRIASRIYLTITGDIVRDFSIKNRYMKGRGPHIVFGFKMKNSGNIRTNLEFDARIYGLFGLYDKVDSVQIAQIFPGKTLSQEILWPGKERPFFGPYFAWMKIYDAYEPMNKSIDIPPAREPVTTWAFTIFIPYTQTAVLVLLLFLAWFLRQFLVWRKMSLLARQPVVVYKVKKGDNLMDVSEDYGVAWKLVARINEIKAPYSLRKVKELYIPDARGTRRDISVVNFWMHISKPGIGLWHKLRDIKKPKEYTIIVDKGDKRQDIEEFTGLTWQRIAIYNALPKTFKLKAGVELKIPGKKPKL